MCKSDDNSENVQSCEATSNKAKKKARGMSCAELLDKINQLANRDKIGGEGTKGLRQRFRDYRGDDATHGPEILKQQRSLRTYLDEYISRGCGDPPGDAVELAKRPLPAPETSRDHTSAKAVAAFGAGLGLGYATYRIARFLPSLLPPLWETIPMNLAIP